MPIPPQYMDVLQLTYQVYFRKFTRSLPSKLQTFTQYWQSTRRKSWLNSLGLLLNLSHSRPYPQGEVDLGSGLSVRIVEDARDLIHLPHYEAVFIVSRTIVRPVPWLIVSTYSAQMAPS